MGAPGATRGATKFIFLGVIAAILIIAGAVLGGVFGSRSGSSESKQAGSSAGNEGSAADSVKPTATDSFGNPIYPTTTGSAKVSRPTFTTNSDLYCPNSTYTFSKPGSLGASEIRQDHPRLIATREKWACLAGSGGSGGLIAKDGYLTRWNATIFANATAWREADPVAYVEDGGRSGSGILDPAREVQNRIKHWAYAYRMTNDSVWVQRAWQELQVAAGNSSSHPWSTDSPDKWNSRHFLDLAELTAAFAIAYDWMYDAWTAEQRNSIMWSILNLGLSYGVTALEGTTGWWKNEPGNWNCVCNGGLIVGALAVLGDDPTGRAATILPLAVESARTHCAVSSSADGTWNETPNYWYFGTTPHVQMALSLYTATGSLQGLMPSTGIQNTGLFHMHTTGKQGLFSYGDSGPNKFTATANSLIAYGNIYNKPEYILFQRDRGDAPDPMAVLYYNAQVSGDFWFGLALDQEFPDSKNSWASMRSSWTDRNGLYVAMRSSQLQGHQTHGDLDVGTFVMDALGERWAGELGNGDYLSPDYFSSEAQNSVRWNYYRKRTEGQNTLLLNGRNQLVSANPVNVFKTTGDRQDALLFRPLASSTAFFTTDMTTAYGTPSRRGIRLLNSRRQVLLQDEITVPTRGTLQWRMHTNATVTIQDGNRAQLSLNGKTLVAQILSPPGASFTTQPAVTTDTSLVTTENQPNPGVTVLTIEVGSGTQNIQVLFNPQWEGMTNKDYVTPPSVTLTEWNLASHD